MVNQNEQPDNAENIITDVTTDQPTSTETPSDPVTADAPVSDAPVSDTPQETSPDAPGDTAAQTTGAPEVTTDPPPGIAQDDLQEKIKLQEQQNAQLQQQNMQYIQQQYVSNLQAEQERVRQYYEGQGLLPEQANQAAQDYIVQVDKNMKTQQDARDTVQLIRDKQSVARQVAKQYDLGMDDLDNLERYNTPQDMETAAKNLKAIRDKDARIKELEARLVPSQSFDDNVSTPAASDSDQYWRDKYLEGDRSPKAEEAGRRSAYLNS